MLRSKVAISDKRDILQAFQNQIGEMQVERRKMREEFKAGKTVHPLSPETFGEATELYEKIKKLSLFPNIYNAKELEKC